MSKIVVVNCATGETVERDMTPAEEAQNARDRVEGARLATEEARAQAARAAATAALRGDPIGAKVLSVLGV